MRQATNNWIKTISDDDLAGVITAWLGRLNGGGSLMTESRAKALLLAANALDEPTLNDFRKLMERADAARIALSEIEIGETPPRASVQTPWGASQAAWLSLALLAFAEKIGYPAENLDPATPPNQFSPAGQVVHQTAAWVRRQTQRSATDRDKLARKLAYVPPSTPADSWQPVGHTAEPTPPARSTVPVRYYEYNESIEIDSDEPMAAPTISPAVPQRNAAITIEAHDLVENDPDPEVRILGESRRVPRPNQEPSALSRRTSEASQWVRENVTRDNVTRAVTTAVRSADAALNRVRESTQTEPQPQRTTPAQNRTRLRVIVMDFPQGHRLPSIQVSVRYKGSKREVAGATNDNGHFVCSLPVRPGPGLTYEVRVDWPAEFGGRRERKRITVHADRTEFELPFYSRLIP